MGEPVKRTPEAPTRVAAGGDSGAVLLKELADAVGAMVADVVRLIRVDARLCGRTVLVMIAMTVIAALLFVGGWLLAATAAVVALSQLESVSLAGAFLAVGGIHVVIAGLLVWRLRTIARDLTFQKSRASLHTIMARRTTADESCSDVNN